MSEVSIGDVSAEWNSPVNLKYSPLGAISLSPVSCSCPELHRIELTFEPTPMGPCPPEKPLDCTEQSHLRTDDSCRHAVVTPSVTTDDEENSQLVAQPVVKPIRRCRSLPGVASKKGRRGSNVLKLTQLFEEDPLEIEKEEFRTFPSEYEVTYPSTSSRVQKRPPEENKPLDLASEAATEPVKPMNATGTIYAEEISIDEHGNRRPSTSISNVSWSQGQRSPVIMQRSIALSEGLNEESNNTEKKWHRSQESLTGWISDTEQLT